MKMTLKAAEENLLKVFSDDYLFSIPAYQRPYAWTTEETGELFDDLITALADAKGDDDMDDVAPYFLGSIVLIKESDQREADVIDGQQRLTTLTILLCVLREIAQQSSSSLDPYIREAANEFAGTKERFRLTLRKRDRKFFMDNIQSPKGLDNLLSQSSPKLANDSQQRLYENAKHLKKVVSDLSSDKQKQLAKFLVQRCYLVVVSVSDRTSAFRIFSVLNTRGLDLLPTDVLKAEIIGGIPDNDQQKYTEEWENAEEQVGRDGFHDLFSHIRMIFVKRKAKSTLEHEFREGVMKHVTGNAFIDDIVIPYQDAYSIVSNAEYRHATDAQKVNAYLEYLKLLDNRDWVAPAIEFYKRNPNDHTAFAKFVKDLERLAYALFILRKNVNERIHRYVKVLNAIEKSDEHSLDKSLELTAEEKITVLEVLNQKIYQETRICKPVLLRLNSALAEDQVNQNQQGTITIEHVLPQKPDKVPQWNEWFPTEELREEWTDRLANLVLLSRRKNSQAQNFDFDRKKKKYFLEKGVAVFAITTQVCAHKQWTPEILEERQADLVNKLKEEWRLG